MCLFKSLRRRNELIELILEWLRSSPLPEERRYLENHLILLHPESEKAMLQVRVALQINLKSVMKTSQSDDNEEVNIIRGKLRDLNKHKELLAAIRVRGNTPAAIREAYVDAYGGFALDVPGWLEDAIRGAVALLNPEMPGQIPAAERITFFQTILDRAAHEHNLAPEIEAEIHFMLGESLIIGAYETGDSGDAWQVHAHLMQALHVYTLERYPNRYAVIQRILGDIYQQWGGDEAEVNLERAIDCFTNALQVFRWYSHPKDCAEVQFKLGTAYMDRGYGERKGNLEKAIVSFNVALDFYHNLKKKFPMEHAECCIKLGIAYVKRETGDRRENINRAVRYFICALEYVTPDTYPVEYGKTMYNLALAYNESVDGKRPFNSERALFCCQRALEIFTLERFTEEHMRALHTLGTIYRDWVGVDRQSNLENALTRVSGIELLLLM